MVLGQNWSDDCAETRLIGGQAWVETGRVSDIWGKGYPSDASMLNNAPSGRKEESFSIKNKIIDKIHILQVDFIDNFV